MGNNCASPANKGGSYSAHAANDISTRLGNQRIEANLGSPKVSTDISIKPTVDQSYQPSNPQLSQPWLV